MKPVDVAQRVAWDIGSLQNLVQSLGTESGARIGWDDLESLLHLARMEAGRLIEREGIRNQVPA